MAEKVLEVKNLTVSFKTDTGLVRAVRDVSFDLSRGETLCIVGESGSGKSVTSKAIMGILANNAIVDDGKIMYQGENLLEISEEEYVHIRGHKIGMIFQDPLSSLNPIVRIGKQITEATLINGNKIKLLYDKLIDKELMTYKNILSSYKFNSKKLEQKYNEALEAKKALYKEEKLTKLEYKEQVKHLTSQYKNDLSKYKKLRDDQLPEAKANLKMSKENAKVEVKKYVDEVNNSYKEELASLHQEFDVKLSSTKDEELKSIKAQYNKRLQTIKENRINKLKITKKVAKERALEIMKEVGIPFPEKRFKQYPFEFSGGMRQRIVIAIALTASPEVLICDEPTTALDVTIQAQILELINKLKRERNLSCIFITHDLGVVANMADRVAVMYAGKIVEYGLVDEIFYEPKHPYTWALLSSIPDVDSKERLEAIQGTPPNMIYPPKGDAFAARSKYAMEIDYKYQPPYFKVSDTHYAATWLLHPKAPKVEMPKIVSERIKKSLERKKSNVK
jgi:oligopeptide transport system ATP-binding protein